MKASTDVTCHYMGSSLATILSARRLWRPCSPNGAGSDDITQSLVCSVSGDTVVDLCDPVGPLVEPVGTDAGCSEDDSDLAAFLRPPAELCKGEDHGGRSVVTARSLHSLPNALDPALTWLDYRLRWHLVPTAGLLVLWGDAKRLGYPIRAPEALQYRGARLGAPVSREIAPGPAAGPVSAAVAAATGIPVHELAWCIAYPVPHQERQ